MIIYTPIRVKLVDASNLQLRCRLTKGCTGVGLLREENLRIPIRLAVLPNISDSMLSVII